ncbi:hypothetical protein D9M68_821970 [compost metagenome]
MLTDQHLQFAADEGLGLREDGQVSKHGEEPLFIEVVQRFRNPHAKALFSK